MRHILKFVNLLNN